VCIPSSCGFPLTTVHSSFSWWSSLSHGSIQHGLLVLDLGSDSALCLVEGLGSDSALCLVEGLGFDLALGLSDSGFTCFISVREKGIGFRRWMDTWVDDQTDRRIDGQNISISVDWQECGPPVVPGHFSGPRLIILDKWSPSGWLESSNRMERFAFARQMTPDCDTLNPKP